MKTHIKTLRANSYIFGKEIAVNAEINHITNCKYWPDHFQLSLDFPTSNLLQDEFETLEEVENYLKENSKVRFYELTDGMQLNFKFYLNRAMNRYYELDWVINALEKAVSVYYINGEVQFFSSEKPEGKPLFCEEKALS